MNFRRSPSDEPVHLGRLGGTRDTDFHERRWRQSELDAGGTHVGQHLTELTSGAGVRRTIRSAKALRGNPFPLLGRVGSNHQPPG